jgi:crossover junction endodeoxyribonuclease RuvC
MMARMTKPSVDKNQKLFCGLDLSLTATGIIVLNQSGQVIHKAVLKSKLKDMERLQYIRNEIAAVYKQYDISFTCLEGYSMGSRSGQAFSIGELGGIIKLFLWGRKHDYHPVPPPQVKKYATKVGNCDKNKVMLAVFKEWGFEGKDDNECDAFVLSHIARAIKLTVPIRKHQAEIILQIRKDRNAKENNDK